MTEKNTTIPENLKFDIHSHKVKSVIDILDSKKFSYSAEIIPPRNGTDFLEVFSHVSELEKSKFDFISVTHGAGGSLRGGTLPIAYHSQNVYNLTSIAHLTCRGMTSEDLENVLIDHHYFGIHNILALRGDPPDGLNESFKPAAGGFSYAYELVKLIMKVNAGQYLKRSGFDTPEKEYREGIKTRFCIGVACYPEDKRGNDIAHLAVKKEAGADFAISQIVFDYDIFAQFFNKATTLWKDTFPILPGIRIPTSYKQLKRMKEKFGINVPDKLLQDMEKASDSEESMKNAGIEWATHFVQQIQSLGVKGIHFFIMGNPQHAISVKENMHNGT